MNFILSIFSGVLLVLSFPNPNLYILAWVAFIPLFFAISGKPPGRRFLLSYITGFIFFSGTVYWLMRVTIPGTLLLILYLSCYFGLFGLALSRKSKLPLFIVIPAVWVVLEYLRAHLLSGFGWVLLGSSQYLNLPLIQIADCFGVFGVSFVVMAVNLALWHLVMTRRVRVLAIPFTVIALTFLYGFFRLGQNPEGVGAKVSVIQANIPQELKWQRGQEQNIFNRHIALTLLSAGEKPDIIIWPESALADYLDLSLPWLRQRFFKEMLSFTEDTGIPILFGAVIQTDKEFTNSAVFIEKGKLKEYYKKIHLVPFGEYIPLRRYLSFLETVVPIGDFVSGREFSVFKLPLASYPQEIRFSVLICFEDTVSELSREFVRRGADLLVNITNDAWFGKGPAAHQHLQASVLRAVENRRFLVRAANTGVSAFIDSRGRILDTVKKGDSEIFVEGFKTRDIILSTEESIYTGMGDIFVLLCLIFYLLETALGWRRS